MDSEQTSTPAPQDDTIETAAAETSGTAATTNSWWDNLNFEGKEYTELKPDGHLVLKATPFSPERPLQMIDAGNAGAITHALTERYNEVTAKVHDLATEWEAAEDKTRLGSKVSRVRDYLLAANAIGDFAPLYQQVALWDNTLQQDADKAYADRLALVEKAEQLSSGEPTKEVTQELRDISDQWKSLGYLDKERADALWTRLETAKNGFFERKRERHEAEQAELSTNLDLKTEIIEKAERFAASDSWKEATEGFKTLMDEWKATGRTFNDKNEALWQRFITAKNVFYDRKKQHFEVIQSEQEGNYAAKLQLVEDAERLAESTEWGKTSNIYNAMMDQWKSIGRVPVDKADELWNRMSRAKDTFFNAKRQHFATIRVGLDDNFAQKSAIIKRAESLQHSTDWRAATDEFTELMEDWKKIGPVAKEHSEPLWERFIKARRNFFNRKDDDRDRRRGQMERAHVARIGQTEEFLSKLREELKEDEESLADFHVSLGNLGGGKKDDQIRANLEKLIAQAGPRIQKKREKITEVETQLRQISKPSGSRQKEDRSDAGKNAAAAPDTVPQQEEKENQPTESTGQSTAGEEPAPSPAETPVARPDQGAEAEPGQ